MVDIDSNHLNVAKSFAEKHSIFDRVSFIRADSLSLSPTALKYDLVFVDPPYSKNMVYKSLVSIDKAKWLNNEALIIIEVASREDVELPDGYVSIDERVYGGSKMIIAKYSSSLS